MRRYAVSYEEKSFYLNLLGHWLEGSLRLIRLSLVAKIRVKTGKAPNAKQFSFLFCTFVSISFSLLSTDLLYDCT